MAASSIVTGIAELDAKLDQLGKPIARRVARAALGAGVVVIARQVKAELDADRSLSPQLRRALKRIVGQSRVADKQRGTYAAKAGFGTGAGGKNKDPLRSGRNRSGKGIGSLNVHWFALGTQPRRNRQGSYRGVITPVRAVGRAYALRGDWAKQKIILTAQERIDAELAKLAVP